MTRTLTSPFLFATLLWLAQFLAAPAVAAEPTAACKMSGVVGSKRVALVIGNAAYNAKVTPLNNPTNDAWAIADVLAELGFHVVTTTDADSAAIGACARRAEELSSDAELALFYYSGHGVQVGDRNFLVATDATGTDDSGLVPVQPIVDALQAKAKATLIFLDACRNNPALAGAQVGLSVATARSLPRGLAPTNAASPTGKVASGRFVAYATSPNTVASDGAGSLSPFTEAFVLHAKTEGASLQRIMAIVTKEVGEATNWAQTPWTRSSLTSEVFLNGAVDPDAVVKASRLKAEEAGKLLASGDRPGAIVAAMQGLPEKLRERDDERYEAAYGALHSAMRSRSLRLPLTESVHASFSPHGERAATVSMQIGSRKEGLRLWDSRTRSLIADLLPKEVAGTSGSTAGPARFSADGRCVAHMDLLDGTAFVWKADDGTVMTRIRLGYSRGYIVSPPSPFVLSPDCSQLLVGGPKGLQAFDVASGSNRYTLTHKLPNATYSPDGRRIVIADTGLSTSVELSEYDAETGRRIAHNTTKSLSSAGWLLLSSLRVSPDGNKAAFTTSANTMVIWDLTTRAINQFEITGGSSSVTWGLAFTEDSRAACLESNDDSGRFTCFSLADGSQVPLAPLHRIAKSSIFDPSGAGVGFTRIDDAGDVWRKVPAGNDLLAAAHDVLSGPERETVQTGRLRFR